MFISLQIIVDRDATYIPVAKIMGENIISSTITYILSRIFFLFFGGGEVNKRLMNKIPLNF